MSTEQTEADDGTEEPTEDEGATQPSGDEPAEGPEEPADGPEEPAEGPEDGDGPTDGADDEPAVAEGADLLIPVDEYLSAGVHIGTQQKTGHMERFIHRVREDGLYVLDVQTTDERIATAASLLAEYEPSQVLVSSSRRYGQHPAEAFAEATGARVSSGRFIPGTLTNPDYEGYIEPDILVVTDPIGDSQAVKEAITVGIPVIAMCDTNNATNNVDLVVPTNNKGRKALSVVYWLLARELLEMRGVETDYTQADFEPDI